MPEDLSEQLHEIAQTIRDEAKLEQNTTSNPALEVTIISACLKAPDAFDTAEGSLSSSDFFTQKNKSLWIVIAELSKRDIEINTTTIAAEFQARGEWKVFGEAAALQEFYDAESNPKEIYSYCVSLKGFSLARAQKRIGLKLEQISKVSLEPTERISQTRELIHGLERFSLGRVSLESLDDILDKIGINKFLSPLEGEELIDTDWDGLNDLIIGYQLGTVNFIGARPSQGKTAIAMQIAMRAALEKGKTCAIFSLETKAQGLFRRACCSMAGVSAPDVQRGTITADERNRLVAAATKLKDAPLYISNLKGNKVSEVASEIRQMASRGKKPTLVIVDYIQLMQPEGKHRDRRGEIDEIAGNIKKLAHEENVALMPLSQLRRPDPKDQNRRPTMQDMMESGALEATADTALILHRPDFYKKNGDRSIVECYLDKQKDGPTGFFTLKADDKYFKFGELKTIDYDGPTE